MPPCAARRSAKTIRQTLTPSRHNPIPGDQNTSDVCLAAARQKESRTRTPSGVTGPPRMCALPSRQRGKGGSIAAAQGVYFGYKVNAPRITESLSRKVWLFTPGITWKQSHRAFGPALGIVAISGKRRDLRRRAVGPPVSAASPWSTSKPTWAEQGHLFRALLRAVT